MKDASSRSPRLGSKQLTCWLGLALLLAPVSIRATDPSFVNSGVINFPIQIDALNFVNSGSFFVNSALPFETSSTRNYTNSGIMSGTPGFFFQNAAANSGARSMSDSFVNLNGGTVEALDGGGQISIIGFFQNVAPSYLWINATNVVNSGTLSVGGSGWLRIQATNMNAARGAFEVTSLVPTGSANVGTNYFNDVGINDVWWGQTNGLVFNSANVYNGNQASAPPHVVQVGLNGPFVPESFTVPQPLAFGYSNATDVTGITLTNADGSTTNFFIPTNIVKQAVFVGLSDPLISADVRFFPSSTFTNPYQTVCVQLVLPETNVITGAADLTTLYFFDTFASETNRGLNFNLRTFALPPFVFQRPANYVLSRLDDGRFAAGTPGNITPDAFYLFDPNTFTNPVANSEYAGYAATVDNLSSEPPPVTPGTVTNFPGRVQLYADNLDFRLTRVRGEGEVIVKANHLLSSAGAAVDCENLSYTLGSTNGNLNFVNLSKQTVVRLKGQVAAWSAIWTNQITFIITNNFAVTNITDTNGVITGTNAVVAPLTNSANVDIYVLILDGDALSAQVPVITWDMAIHSTNIVVSDSLSVVQTFLLDGESFTLNGTINLTSTSLQNVFGQSVTTELRNWVYTNAPGLLHFTNNGTLTVPSEAHFGDDGPIPYSDFVNTGFLRGGSINADSAYVENGGTLNANVGPLELAGTTGKFQNGSSLSGGDLNLSFSDLKFFNHRLNASGAINLVATSALSDAGASSGNTFTMGNGFNLPAKPATGDLLGTTFQDAPPDFVEVDHSWAGQDRGNSSAGFTDNTAIGRLVLTAQSTVPARAPLFLFRGATGQNGLYVDLLDLSSLGTNYLNMLQIDPSVTIYFAAARLGFTPPANSAGIPQLPEEFLNALFGGHLVWVSSFAGPNSSTAIIVNGQTVVINTALRNSKIIDSDGDGIPNFFDSTPLGGSGGTPPAGFSLGQGFLSRPSTAQQVFSLTWNALANTAYRVEMTTDLANPNWQLVSNYDNTLPTAANVTISDTNNVNGRQRFYRVRVVP